MIVGTLNPTTGEITNIRRGSLQFQGDVEVPSFPPGQPGTRWTFDTATGKYTPIPVAIPDQLEAMPPPRGLLMALAVLAEPGTATANQLAAAKAIVAAASAKARSILPG